MSRCTVWILGAGLRVSVLSSSLPVFMELHGTDCCGKKNKDFGRIYLTRLLRGCVFGSCVGQLCLPRLENFFMVWRADESFKAGRIPAGGFSPENHHGHHTEELSMDITPKNI